MLILLESSAGFAVFKLLDEKKLKNVDNLYAEFETAQSASKVVQLIDFHKFHDSAEALAAAVALNEGSMCKPLKSLLKKVVKQELHKKLAVLDTKLGASIKSKIPDLQIVNNSSVQELIRCIRGQMTSLIPGISEKEFTAMSLGLGHNLARYKLKFSPDKVDTMVVQAINLLDDLEKEHNNYVMRAKEWYGWHFPELSKILQDNTAYIQTIIKMGFRENASKTDFSSVLSEELSERVKEAAEVSMGCEISEIDLEYMQELCRQVQELAQYRQHLQEYLSNRMESLAPNLCVLVGDIVGARLIAHAGSLINLAKNPASTVQLIGAEKALFRALKTMKNTPKYGLIYHAEMVAKCPAACKGKMSRMLAAKVSLATRVDALGDDTTTTTTMGADCRVKLQKKLTYFNSGKTHRISGQGRHPVHHIQGQGGAGFQAMHDSTVNGLKRERDAADSPTPDADADADADAAAGSPPAKRRKQDRDEHDEVEPIVDELSTTAEKKKKKKKKEKRVKSEDQEAADVLDEPAEKKHKKKHTEVEVKLEETAAVLDAPEKKKKKKKKNKD